MKKNLLSVVLLLVTTACVIGSARGWMNGIEIYLLPCDSTAPAAQKWSLELITTITTSTTVAIHNKATSTAPQCVDLDGWSVKNGSVIHMWDCHLSTAAARPENQLWTINTDEATATSTVSTYMDPNYLLTAAIVPIKSATIPTVQLWRKKSNTAATDPSQQWVMNPTTGMIYNKKYGSGLCVTPYLPPLPPPPTCLDAQFSQSRAYCDASKSVAERTADLVNIMKTDEKLSMVHGTGSTLPYVGIVVPANDANLAIPHVYLEDGPQGVADGAQDVTFWPSALTVTASWDHSLYRRYGAAQATEQKTKGATVLLGPMVNLARVPVGGRNFESCGEDPILAAVYAAEFILGVQSDVGIMACIKHFALNNQERDRTTVSAVVDERTKWELYYPQFQAAVDAEVASAMCSYNKVNGTWACENDRLLNRDLKGKMGFKGFVVSDWGATHSTVQAANSGLDMEMSDMHYFGEALTQAVKDGLVPMSRVNEMVSRTVAQQFTLGMFDRVNNGSMATPARSVAHDSLARELAESSAVLLKNDGSLLPLSLQKIKTIAVIGKPGHSAPILGGLGSGQVVPPYIVSAFRGIQSYTAAAGIEVTYDDGSNPQTVMKLAASSDVAIVVAAVTSSEGIDRDDLSLGSGQDELISLVSKVQSSTVVVLNIPGAVTMPWISQVPAVLTQFLPGQEAGTALANLLFAAVTPSGKLPLSFPVSMNDTWLTSEEQYPGVGLAQKYTEGLLVGYRWYDEMGKAPLFPFGHGLSYTTFKYSDMAIITETLIIKFTLTNTGSYIGAEVSQLYIGYPGFAGEPPKLLREFKKTNLRPGQSVTVEWLLSPQEDLAVYDVAQGMFTPVSGCFSAHIGSSSRDIRLESSFCL